MALYIFSDAHLGAHSDELETLKRQKIAALFDMVRTDGDRLVILGDLFDFWFEYKHAIPKDHHRVLCMLDGLIQQGIRIDYVSGNHDFWMGDFFTKEMGVAVHRDTLDLGYEGKRLHLIHGDGLAKADKGYRFLKRILRNRVNIWLYRKLTPDWAIPLAKAVSGSSRNYTSGRDPDFVADYEEYAKEKLSGNYDIVAIGHLHIPAIKQFDSGTYINTGDFIESFTYAKVGDGKCELVNLL
ncbi:MAG: UDP-2,3-diacylglucosamine diphosphatase [candidate division Zixibacteria bacterium]|nr:UDP-2,3-diacylglucosamine diphosphatase [candidate division Zixibacteria bacterium]MDH3935892.1 UDP-2,3-diacylglucosamine diphosphatase [candidate division Zixibacteria bacterium]MDH4032696.1 UDP-2,3-diacylglucosamine diphosphatase [candidate division Zixibacteria bacterium]